MKKTIPGTLLIAAALAFAGPAAADSMRCGTKLMTDGDPVDKVQSYCGPPASIERREILRPWGYQRGVTVHSTYEVSVEIWTYNFGPYKLMRQIRFVDGVVDEIESLGYGYHETPSPTADARSDRRDTYR